MTDNLAVWQAWGEQRDQICDPHGTHTLDEDWKHGCSHETNSGNIVVLRRGPTVFKRCNIFFCPHAADVSKRAMAIQKGDS